MSQFRGSRHLPGKPPSSPLFDIAAVAIDVPLDQAVVKILSADEHRENFDQSLLDNFFHTRHKRCLVRGIAFFGTPFEGSKLADMAPFIGPAIGLRTGPGSFISALKVKDPQVQAIIHSFDIVRREPSNRIRLVIFFEKKAMGKYFLKTMVSTLVCALWKPNSLTKRR